MGGQIIKTTTQRPFSRSSGNSDNPYLGLLLKIYRFLARRTNSRFNSIVLRRLFKSRINQSPISLSRLAKFSIKNQKKILVVVGKVLNDERILDIPPISVCALRLSNTVRNRIQEAGGKVFTFDQVVLISPTGKNTVLVRGPKKEHKTEKKKHKKTNC